MALWLVARLLISAITSVPLSRVANSLTSTHTPWFICSHLLCPTILPHNCPVIPLFRSAKYMCRLLFTERLKPCNSRVHFRKYLLELQRAEKLKGRGENRRGKGEEECEPGSANSKAVGDRLASSYLSPLSRLLSRPFPSPQSFVFHPIYFSNLIPIVHIAVQLSVCLPSPSFQYHLSPFSLSLFLYSISFIFISYLLVGL